MQNTNNIVYEVILDGFVYRGTRKELTQIIREWRENHK